jgi:hypothetical protein
MENTHLAVNYESQLESWRLKSRLEDSLFSKDLAPHYMKLAGQLATSDLVPKSFRGKPQDLFLCWALGYQIGMSPEQAMQCIAIVNGKAVMWGDELLALCMSHRDFEDIIETPIIKNDAVIGYNCTVKRKGKSDKQSIFTLEMAKKAGLLAKGGVWNQYPERMLKLRARGFCLRDAFPDALKGIKSREEVEDYIDADYSVRDNKPSRTEQLKQELTSEHVAYRCIPTVEDKEIGQENTLLEESREHLESQVSTAELHTQIKKLIHERSFPEDRLLNALKYYEVDSIEELSISAANDFFNKIINI